MISYGPAFQNSYLNFIPDHNCIFHASTRANSYLQMILGLCSGRSYCNWRSVIFWILKLGWDFEYPTITRGFWIFESLLGMNRRWRLKYSRGIKSWQGIGPRRADNILELREQCPEPFKEVKILTLVSFWVATCAMYSSSAMATENHPRFRFSGMWCWLNDNLAKWSSHIRFPIANWSAVPCLRGIICITKSRKVGRTSWPHLVEGNLVVSMVGVTLLCWHLVHCSWKTSGILGSARDRWVTSPEEPPCLIYVNLSQYHLAVRELIPISFR